MHAGYQGRLPNYGENLKLAHNGSHPVRFLKWSSRRIKTKLDVIVNAYLIFLGDKYPCHIKPMRVKPTTLKSHLKNQLI